MRNKEPKERTVVIECNEKQANLISHAMEFMARAMEGQMDFTVQELMETAHERRYQEEHPDYPKNIAAPDFHEVREKLEDLLQQCRELVWGLEHPGPSLYRYHIDQTPQNYWSMYECMRYARYLALPEDEREMMRWTVMSNKPMGYGDQPLIKVKYKK